MKEVPTPTCKNCSSSSRSLDSEAVQADLNTATHTFNSTQLKFSLLKSIAVSKQTTVSFRVQTAVYNVHTSTDPKYTVEYYFYMLYY